MAVYRVQAPDGSIVRIEAPDDATQEQLAQAVNAYAQAAQAPAGTPKPRGFIDNVKEAATGTERTTPEVQEALDAGRTIYDMPESNNLSWGLVKAALGGMFANSKERAEIFAANLPGVQLREDAAGNQWLRSSADGQEYVIPPGFKTQDVPRTAGMLAAFTPAGRAASLPGAALAGGATQAVIEGTQAAAGGNFNPEDVAIASVLPPAMIGTVNAVKAAAAPMRKAVQAARSKVTGVPPAQPAAAAPVNPAAVAPEVPPAAPAAAPVAPVTPMPAADLAQTAKKAAEGGLGSKGATRVLAEQAAPDAKVVDAAKRLGIDDYLQPDHVTTNQAYRELAQAVKSFPGSEARAAELQGLEQVAKRADDLIDEIGGTTDMSMLDATVKNRLMTTQRALEKQADDLYKQVREGVPVSTPAPANNVLSFIEQRAKDLGGEKNLTPMEKMIVSKLKPKPIRRTESVPGNPLMPGAINSSKRTVEDIKQPTYALLDDVRKDLGAAARMAGPFKDADIGLSKKLYSLLSDDQSAIVGNLGMSETFNAARAAVATRKGLEDDLAALFGKNLDQSLLGDLSGSVRTLSSGDVSRLVRLLKAVPEDLRPEVVASGLNTAFGKNARNGNLNFNSYAQWYDGLLRNKQAYTALMSNLPQHSRKQLSDLYRVSKAISAASKERITTGRLNAVSAELKGADSLLENIYSLAKRTAVAVPIEAATTSAGLPGTGLAAVLGSALTKGKTPSIKAADALIASDEFIALAKQAGKPGEKAARLRLVHSKPFSRYVRAVGQPRELNERERWVLQAMQAQNQQQR